MLLIPEVASFLRNNKQNKNSHNSLFSKSYIWVIIYKTKKVLEMHKNIFKQNILKGGILEYGNKRRII